MAMLETLGVSLAVRRTLQDAPDQLPLSAIPQGNKMNPDADDADDDDSADDDTNKESSVNDVCVTNKGPTHYTDKDMTHYTNLDVVRRPMAKPKATGKQKDRPKGKPKASPKPKAKGKAMGKAKASPKPKAKGKAMGKAKSKQTSQPNAKASGMEKAAQAQEDDKENGRKENTRKKAKTEGVTQSADGVNEIRQRCLEVAQRCQDIMCEYESSGRQLDDASLDKRFSRIKRHEALLRAPKACKSVLYNGLKVLVLIIIFIRLITLIIII
jgi:hypothetical protein